MMKLGKILDLSYITLSGVKVPPLSVILGITTRIHHVIDGLIRYYFPKCRSIWDCTCGTENHQFADYLTEINGDWYYHGKIYYFPTDKRKTKWTKMTIDLFRQPYPFRDEAFDLIVYDPPFPPISKQDKRGKDYDTNVLRSPLQIKKFYSEDILKEFHRICRQGVIIRGQDFYFPVMSDNFYVWTRDVCDLDVVRKYFKVTAIHTYRYYHHEVPIIRQRIGLGINKRQIKRMMIVHSYLLIGYKKRT